MLSNQALIEFKAIWLDQNPGKTISDQELLSLAAKVIRAVELLYDDTENL